MELNGVVWKLQEGCSCENSKRLPVPSQCPMCQGQPWAGLGVFRSARSSDGYLDKVIYICPALDGPNRAQFRGSLAMTMTTTAFSQLLR